MTRRARDVETISFARRYAQLRANRLSESCYAFVQELLNFPSPILVDPKIAAKV
jgi:hypothetical protein